MGDFRSQPKISETRQDAPWSGELSADLLRGSLRVNADGLALIDAKGVCWGILFPDKSGFYDHVPLIVEAVNSNASLKADNEGLKKALNAVSVPADVRKLKARVEEQEEREMMILAHLYNAAPLKVANLCDDVLDRSGGLLGRVRDRARAALSPSTPAVSR